MLTVLGEPTKIAPSFSNSAGTGFEGHEFFEASSIRKVGDKYCFIWSSYYGHELCYALSDDPEGPFEFGGTIISNGDIGVNGIRDEADCDNYIGNNHGSIEKINGKWYVFYHRHTNRRSFSRQACAERINVLPDGHIPQVEMTSCGLNGGPLAGKGVYPAPIACILKSRSGAMRGEVPLRGIHPYITQDGEDGQDEAFQHIANFRRGAVCGYKYFSPDGATTLSVTIRGDARGFFTVTDGAGNMLSHVNILSSRGWQTFSAPFKCPRERFALYFTFEGDGAVDFLRFSLD